MVEFYLRMKRFLIAFSSGLIVLITFNSGRGKSIKAQNLLKSCRNYPYDLGINLKQMRSGSFQLLSTSIMNTKIDKTNSISRALRAANLRAKLNISNFIKLTNNSKEKNISEVSFPIRINGRLIKTNSQLKNKIGTEFIYSSSNLSGVSHLAQCKNNRDHVMVTVEITNDTIRAANYIEKGK